MYKHWNYNPERERYIGIHEIAKHLPTDGQSGPV